MQSFLFWRKKGQEINCFGLQYTEDLSMQNLIDRKYEALGILLPDSFQLLEDFKDGHTLECFRCLNKDAINTEMKALHFSAPVFLKEVMSNNINWKF